MSKASLLERHMLALINAERTSRSLEPFVLEQNLNSSAELHSDWMLATNVFSHTGKDGSTHTQRIQDAEFDLSGTWQTAENIAVQSERGSDGYLDDVTDLHIALMNSPGHRANLLDPDLENIGIGVSVGDFDYDSGTYFSVIVTQNFATTEGDVIIDHGPFGTPEADLGYSTEEDEVFDGGPGYDTVVYSGNQSSYTMALSSNGVLVSDRRLQGDGSDTLIDIENLQFADAAFRVDIRDGAALLGASDFAAITELYVAYFNRAPASKGLLYWADRLEDGMTMPEIAESFFEQPETQSRYREYLSDDGQLIDTSAFVTAVFNNVLGRDPTGPYWINELNDPGTDITPALFILAVLNGAKAATGDPADAAYLKSKTDIGVYFSAIKGLSDYDDTVAVMSLYNGSRESVDDAISEVDRIYADALDPLNGEFLTPLIGVIDDPFV